MFLIIENLFLLKIEYIGVIFIKIQIYKNIFCNEDIITHIHVQYIKMLKYLNLTEIKRLHIQTSKSKEEI